MSGDDQAAVEALQRVSLYRGNSDDDGTHLHMIDLCEDEARAIIDAVRKGEVPGVVTDDVIQTTKLTVYESALEEIAALRAEVEREKARATVAEAWNERFVGEVAKLTKQRDRLAGLLKELRDSVGKVMMPRADCECSDCLFLRSIDTALAEVKS